MLFCMVDLSVVLETWLVLLKNALFFVVLRGCNIVPDCPVSLPSFYSNKHFKIGSIVSKIISFKINARLP